MVEWKKAFHSMEMTPADYFKKFVIPIMAMGIAFPIIIQIAASSILTPEITIVLYSIPFIFLLLGAHPKGNQAYFQLNGLSSRLIPNSKSAASLDKATIMVMS